MPPETIAHYRLRERLGSGAMGEVWLAEDTRLHRLVALKMLPRKDASDAEAAARLLREARVASSLSHPNVAVVYDVGEVEHGGQQACYVAMEYVKGRTLAQMLEAGRMEAASILPIARQVAEALADAHEHGVVHRDVKPGNVMVNERGLVKVLDFGLARFAPPAHEESATWSGNHGALEGAIVGTLAYMSPEQARGHAVDARSDVFSFGVLLYELLAGRRPFEGRNAVELVEAILTKSPPPPSAEGPLAAGVFQLVARMLEKDPARRPAGMRDVLRDLDALLAGNAPALAPGRDHTVAVAGFANVTGRPEDAWLGTGLAETVSAGLAEVPGLAVVSRERILEVLREMGLPPDADDPALAVRVGREVGAHGVVSGAYQSLGDRIRVTARVTETATGRVALNPRVDGAREAIFELQDRLVAELVAGLRGQLPAARPEETQSVEAYEACSKGLLNLQEESQESIDRAIVFFERAVALDPGYARAHMLLGAALDLKGDYLTTPELSERALVSLDRALALRPDSAEAWRYRGSALITLNRDEEALAAFEKRPRPQPAGRLGPVRDRPRPLHPARRLRPGRRRLRAGPRPQPAGRLERPPARALRDPAARLPEGRGRGPARDRAAAGLPLGTRGDGHRRGPHAPRPRVRAPGAPPGSAPRVRERGGVPAERGPRAPRAHRHRAAPEDRRGAPPARRGGGGPGRPRPRDRGLRAEDAHRRRRRHEPVLRGGRPRAARREGARPRLPGAGRGRSPASHRRPRRDRAGARVPPRRAALPGDVRFRPSGRTRPRRGPSPPPPPGGGSPGRAAARARS